MSIAKNRKIINWELNYNPNDHKRSVGPLFVSAFGLFLHASKKGLSHDTNHCKYQEQLNFQSIQFSLYKAN